jgi:chromosome segregation ATPase
MYYNTNYNIIQKVVIMALTTADIHAAADKLHAEGINPTQTKVREALGGGSFSTIGEALKTWKQELQQHKQLKQTDMPDSLRDESTVFIAKLWQAADQIANERLTAEREALAIDRAKSQAEIDDANEAIAALEAEQAETLNLLKLSDEKAQQATSEAEASANEIVSLNTFITDLNHKLDIEQERTAAATATLTATNDKLDSTRAQLDDTNDQLTKAKESIATYKATNSAQAADIERLQADATKSKQAHQVTIDKLTERTTERDELAKKLAAAEGKLEAVTAQSKQLVAERDSAITDNKALSSANAKLETANERLIADIADITEKLRVAKTKK